MPVEPLLLGSQIESFILFIGPISSIFNDATFFVMVQVFDWWYSPSLFHTSWFVELLFTQTLTHHVICTNKIPFIESWASWLLILTSVLIVAAGRRSRFCADAAALPAFFAVIMLGGAVLTQLTTAWFIGRFGE